MTFQDHLQQVAQPAQLLLRPPGWRSPDEYEAASWTQLAAKPAPSTIQFDSMGARQPTLRETGATSVTILSYRLRTRSPRATSDLRHPSGQQPRRSLGFGINVATPPRLVRREVRPDRTRRAGRAAGSKTAPVTPLTAVRRVK
jgi:hypothetical protein